MSKPIETTKASETVKVVVRCRPMNPDEVAQNYKRVVDMEPLRGVVLITNPKGRADEVKREFTYDAVYDWNSKQIDLYDETFRPIVDAVLQGYNGTVFAYGQTGTGKTYTMEGVRNDPDLRGVIPNSFDHIFTHISRTEDEHYLVRASYLEIYLEDIRDLLSKDPHKRLDLKEKPDTGVYVKDLSSFVAKSVKEIEHVMHVGNKNRSVGRTAMNEHSSRSHAIFIVTVECSSMREDGENHIRAGRLNLVDLAGSERQSKTGSTGDRFKEAAKINLSLSSLGNVISALVDGKSSHIPYRDSKLTRLLQDSLGGNAKTVMVANVGPAEYNYEETLTTLRYANRAKNITNKPRINEDPKDALLREYQEEILRLKNALEKRKKKGGRKHRVESASTEGGSDSESEESIKASRLPSTIKAQEELLEMEKRSVMQNKELLDEEREKLLFEVHSKEMLLQKEQKKRDQLQSKIKAMESKLLAGNVKDRSDDAKKALEKKRQEVIAQKRKEREIRQQLDKKEESTLEMKETFSSLQEEIEIKSKKLNKIKTKLRSARAEIADYKEEQAKLREELAMTVSNLQRELKLRSLIIDNFIPPEEVRKVVNRAFYKEEEEEWVQAPAITRAPTDSTSVEPRPVSTKGCLYPTTAFARRAAKSGDPRFMADNILKVELEMPNRTTQEFEVPSMSSNVQAILAATMKQDDEEIIVDAMICSAPSTSSPVVPEKSRKLKKKFSKKSSSEHVGAAKSDTVGSANSANSNQYADNASTFPSSRGLVSKPVRFA